MQEKRIIISCGDLLLEGIIDDTPTGEAIYAMLPLEGTANRWGEEIYFEIPCTCALEPESRDALDPGELGYWPTGKCFCIFFGRTPASGTDGRPRAASAVNVFGRVAGDLTVLRQVKQGSTITVKKDDFVLGG